MIEEDLAVEIAVDKAVGARIEFLAIARRLDAERIELGMEMAAHAVGADQHQGAHRIARRLMDVGAPSSSRALGLRLGGKLGADGLFDLRPIAVERGGQIVLRRQRPVVAAPGGAFGVLADVGRGVFQALEELLPFGIDRAGVLFIAGVEIVDIGGVGALQKGGEGKCGIRVLARHDCVLVISIRAWKTALTADPRDRISVIGPLLPYMGRMFSPKRTKN